MKHPGALAYAAFAVVCIVWGTTYLGIRIAIETIPPLLLTGARYTTAGLIMFAIAKFRGERVPRDRHTLGNLLLIGTLMAAVGNLAVVLAEQWVPSGMTALLVATAPFWATLIERLHAHGERIDARSAIGMFVGFGGVALLVTPSGSAGHLDLHFLLGVLILQVGSIAWQWGTARAKYTLGGVPFVMATALQMLFGGLVADTIGFAIGEGSRFVVTPRTFTALAYLALFGTVLTYSAYVYAIGHIPTAQMSLYAHINPLVAVFLGWLILDERLTWVSILAMCVILAGVAIVQTTALRARIAARAVAVIEQKSAA
jgi:drug/metabolite transporter (DMT)-like permease